MKQINARIEQDNFVVSNKELIGVASAVGAYLTKRGGKVSGFEIALVLGIVTTLTYKLCTRL
ncbi:TPA: hypothetical protein I7108_003072 [Vibrio cholerae O1]|uniref:hypothetical protein n=1 Tax=Vibrio cholerae TaxID=666 RepID=UPI00118605F7|nr:hypothetical protein [Vibrio cholerae]HAS2379468.1 hypothetical protein [Vibrio cholerae O1]ELZ1193319.1 hypothetical protein [Vibrio cholerae]MCX9534791.1 hypothetical protein [Vibrio cholerae]MDV2408608.1 hypothetical protein [Vibrio cholerae]TVM80445.1 hypothetical protein FPV46_04880 [Vibrio cholerae]